MQLTYKLTSPFVQTTRLFHQGAYWTVESLVVDGEAPAEVFLDSLKGDHGRAGKSYNGLIVAIYMRADMRHGQRMSETRFKAVHGKRALSAFKSDQSRLFCCYAPGMRIILLNGQGGKKQDESRAAERTAIDKAMTLMAGYLASLAK